MTSLRTAWALLGPTTRATKYGPLLVGAGLGLALVSVPAVTRTDLDSGSWASLLRFAVIATTLGVTFVLDDESAPTTSTLPVSRLLRHTLRVFTTLPIVATCWLTVAVIAGHAAAGRQLHTPLRLPALTVEAATVFFLAVALTTAVRRLRPDGSVGLVAAPVFLALVGVLYYLPDRVALFVDTTSARWDEVHDIWDLILVLTVLAAVLLGREPAAGRSWTVRGRRRRARQSEAGRPAETPLGDPHPEVVP